MAEMSHGKKSQASSADRRARESAWPALLSAQAARVVLHKKGATMKKITLFGTIAVAAVVTVSAAQAADMLRKAPPAPYMAAPFNWTGFYVGAHVGAGWSTKEWSSEGVTVANYNLNGFLGGGQIGYNWQSGWAVLGVEADASLTNIKGDFFAFSSKIDALGTVTARFGGAVDHALVYVKGGGAWAHEKHTIEGEISDSQTRWGWTVGTGVEYAFAPNWSGKVEYNFLDFGKANFFGDVVDGGVDIRQTVHTVKFGLNYRFGGPMAGGY
jgi:outer membrane immunogenic protein